MIEWLITGFIIIAAGIFAYMTVHINEERKRGKTIPLFWEKKDKVKNHIVIMGEDPSTNQVKYLHGNFGKGTFTFYGGHDPEDYQHFVGDPPTDLSLHRNSPGYRLILNNILFPAARKKERKT